MRCVIFTGAGGNEVVEVVERADAVPGDEEVLVRVTHAGLNPADVSQRAGRYPAPPGFPGDVPGLEVAGTVVACGAKVLRWKAGDRVLGLVGGGGLAELVAVHERCVAPVPTSLDDVSAAATAEAFITAHDAIRTRGRLAMGDTILVHGANGGVGSAAIQIAVRAGARALGTVRSDAAADLVRSLGGEPVPDATFADAVGDLTGGRGADVILELVGAVHFPANLAALAVRGRIVIVGVGAGNSTDLSLLGMMQKRAELHGTVLRARPLEEKAAALRAFEREVLPGLADRRLRPLVDSVYPVADVRAAFDRLEGPGKAGKVLVSFA
jgi:putative PIG3 family NAD(P)H quinone oxidoreductase